MLWNESLVRRAAEMMEDDVAGFFDLDPEDLQ